MFKKINLAVAAVRNLFGTARTRIANAREDFREWRIERTIAHLSRRPLTRAINWPNSDERVERVFDHRGRSIAGRDSTFIDGSNQTRRPWVGTLGGLFMSRDTSHEVFFGLWAKATPLGHATA